MKLVRVACNNYSTITISEKSRGIFSLIGASASCSSYQQPRRGRGRKLKAGITVAKGTAILYGVVYFNCFNFLFNYLEGVKLKQFRGKRIIFFMKVKLRIPTGKGLLQNIGTGITPPVPAVVLLPGWRSGRERC